MSMTCFMSRQPLDFQQLFVSEGDVLGGQARVAGAQQVLAVEVLLRLDGPGIDAEQPARRDTQIPVQAGLVEITTRSSARFTAVSLSLPAISSSSWASMRALTPASRPASSGLWADRRGVVRHSRPWPVLAIRHRRGPGSDHGHARRHQAHATSP